MLLILSLHMFQNEEGTYKCACRYFIGDYCEEDIDECESTDICENKGTCSVRA